MSKEYACFDHDRMSFIGMCRLDKPDPPGTGHAFGNVCYTLIHTDVKTGVMWFKMDAIQPYLDAE